MIAFGIGTPHDGALFADKPVLDQIWTWIQVGGFRADFGLGMDRSVGGSTPALSRSSGC